MDQEIKRSKKLEKWNKFAIAAAAPAQDTSEEAENFTEYDT